MHCHTQIVPPPTARAVSLIGRTETFRSRRLAKSHKKASAYGVSGRRWQVAGCRYAPSRSVHPCTVLHLLSVSSRDLLMLGRPPSKGKKMAALKGIRVRGSARNWSQGQLDTTVLLSTCIGVVICDWVRLTVTDSDEAQVLDPLRA